MKFSISEINKIKLVIWDLDETFWNGTLSSNGEGAHVTPKVEACELVKLLSRRGIVNSVCSKNNKLDAEEKLREFGVLDFFVFNSINWDPKGSRIKNIISSMALRPQNVLFLDDNPTNLAEAEFELPEIKTAGPEIILDMLSHAPEVGKDDSSLSRLNQYKVLEKKHKDSESFSSNLEFLRNSNIVVSIQYNCLTEVDRIYELIQRTNQLNFTKKRISRDELISLLNDNNYKCGYVMAKDNYGEYGIIGFFAEKKKELEHFLFSCRTMGMGIEQFVYSYLNYPELVIIQDVSGKVDHEGAPDYITLVDSIEEKTSQDPGNGLSILMKGPCDLEVMAAYVEAKNCSVTKEFNFVDELGNQQDFYNHTVNILNSLHNRKQLEDLSKEYSFISEQASATQLFSKKYDFICLSPLMDATLSVYRRKKDGLLFPFGAYNKPLTDKANWSAYLDRKVMTARCNFTQEDIDRFYEEFEAYEYSEMEIVDNICEIIQVASKKFPSTRFILLLLAELPFDEDKSKRKYNFEGKDKIHIKINALLRQKFRDNKNVYLLDVNQYIKSQNDYFDNINHYSKMVYYKMAMEMTNQINKGEGKKISTSIGIKAKIDNMMYKIYKFLYIRKK